MTDSEQTGSAAPLNGVTSPGAPEEVQSPSPAPSAIQPLPKALLAPFQRPPRGPLSWAASGVTENAMASGMVAMKRAMANGLRD